MQIIRRGLPYYWRRLITPRVPLPEGYISGRGFTQNPTVSGAFEYPNTIEGRGFASSPEIHGGAVISGRGFSSSPSITISFTYDAYVLGEGFYSDPNIIGVGGSIGNIAGRGFTQTPDIYGGGSVIGYGFYSNPAVFGVSSEKASVSGRGFLTLPIIYGVAPSTGVITGRGFNSTLFYSKITGSAFNSTPVIAFEYTVEYAEAYVMNTLSNQVTRYENYPFFHVGKIGTSYYGFTSTGVYELTGANDVTTTVSGEIWTNDTDFGEFNSKNVPYIYLNGDDDYSVTAVVDSIDQPTFNSGFSGRRVKLARGSKGRYWYFKIAKINRLQGIEFNPDILSRRVK